MVDFTHLHVHTEYSLLDGAAVIKKVVAKAKALGQKSIAMTDHGVMYGTIAFYNECKEAGIKAIVGCEFYVCENMQEKKGKVNGEFAHLILLAKNENGYRNIAKMDSLAFVDGFYYKPRIDLNLIRQYSKDIVCLTACLAGTVPQNILNDQYEKADEYLKTLKEIFNDDLYVEIMDHGIREEKYVLPQLVKIARENNVKIVASNDVHYVEKKDSEMHDVLLCIQTGKTLTDTNRMKFETEEFYLKSGDEMAELFSEYPESISNTLEVAEKCNLKISFGMPLLPNYVPDEGTASEYLLKLTYQGLRKRYGDRFDEVKERADFELGIINRMGFVEYFLIVWDFINYAKMNGIPVGPGRGSGVGSIVAYAIGITGVCPLKYHLFFERFLNPDRVSMPDFDIDFCYERRGEVIDYVVNKYKKDKVAQIVTFGRLAPRAAIKDVARVYNVPYSEVNKITPLIPSVGKVYLSDLFVPTKETGLPKTHIPELWSTYNDNFQLKRIIDMAMNVEGMPKNTSMHAAGVVICKEVISSYVPLQRNGNEITTQFTMGEIEKLGLLKMDFLGLRTLTDVKKAVDYIFDDYGVKIDFDELGISDAEVYKLISSGETDAIFQVESVGMKRFMQNLKPDCMDDIIAGVALFRPGPMDFIPDYIKGKSNPAAVVYDHPMLEQFLKITYGVIVYQEQVMQIVQEVAGFSLGEADNVRRVMSKKKAAEMKIVRDDFINGKVADDGTVTIDGALRRGLTPEVAGKIFDKMETFASYAFNKSHATAYAYITYQTGFLKRYYPVQFLCSVLNNRITKLEELTKYTTYAKDKNIEVLQPDINKSSAQFKSEDKVKIRFGLAAIKNVGESAVEHIIKIRANGEFKDFADFLYRASEHLNKRMVECLIKAGAFDCFNKHRSQLMQVYEMALDVINKERKNKVEGQLSLFGDVIEEQPFAISYFDCKEFELKHLLAYEKEVIGLYISGHPLDDYVESLKKFSFNTSKLTPIGDVEDEPSDVFLNEFVNNRVSMGGIFINLTQTLTKSEKRMAYGKIEDMYGQLEVVFFPRVFEKYADLIKEDSAVIVSGTLTVKNDTIYQINVEKVESLVADVDRNVIKKQTTGKLYLKVGNEAQLDLCQETLLALKGDVVVIAKYNDATLEFPYKSHVTDTVLMELREILGEDSVVFKSSNLKK